MARRCGREFTIKQGQVLTFVLRELDEGENQLRATG